MCAGKEIALAKNRYGVGDHVVLKAQGVGAKRPQGEGKIVFVQPESQSGGPPRYRIRLIGENFDRSIGEDDIDTSVSQSKQQQVKSSGDRKPGSGWINSSSMKINK